MNDKELQMRRKRPTTAGGKVLVITLRESVEKMVRKMDHGQWSTYALKSVLYSKFLKSFFYRLSQSSTSIEKRRKKNIDYFIGHFYKTCNKLLQMVMTGYRQNY